MCPLGLPAWSGASWRCYWLVWFERGGGQVMTLNQSIYQFCFEEMTSLTWAQIVVCYVAMAQKSHLPLLTAHHPANCLAFVIWLWQWRKSTLSLCLNILQPWEMMHLSCVSWIESGNLPVLKQELMSSKSSLFEFDRCANLIYSNFTCQFYCHFHLTHLKSSVWQMTIVGAA